MTTSPVTTPPNAMPLARNAVYRVGRCYMSSWQATAPVLDAAGELLQSWCVTADQHGVDMSVFSAASEWVDRLAVIALEMTCRNARELRPATHEQAIALLDAVVTRLAERGIKTQRRKLHVPLPRADTVPEQGTSRPAPLAITIELEHGWMLVTDEPVASPLVEIVGRCDEAGIDALLDLAYLIDEGVYGDAFHR
ncbi:hypothetical protein [Nocardia sp. NRRL S-836]|uniref:hypothetical protein n=1 Tax=Nocardia sp. NRRL S-836 TaxID=1519492 RepID=UPI0012FAE63E|nr:hypothetical protein [Nocardia sp. NRRL S-836]